MTRTQAGFGGHTVEFGRSTWNTIVPGLLAAAFAGYSVLRRGSVPSFIAGAIALYELVHLVWALRVPLLIVEPGNLTYRPGMLARGPISRADVQSWSVAAGSIVLRLRDGRILTIELSKFKGEDRERVATALRTFGYPESASPPGGRG